MNQDGPAIPMDSEVLALSSGKVVTAHRYRERESSIPGAEHWGWSSPVGLDDGDVAEARERLREVEADRYPEVRK